MASSVKSVIEPGSSPSNPSPTPTTTSDSSPILSESSSIQNEELQIETRYTPPQAFYAGAHHVPPMAYSGPYTGQPLYYPPPPPNYPTYNDYPSNEKGQGKCLCRLIVIFIALFTFLVFFLTTIKYIYKPKHPSVSITSATLTALTLSNSSTIMSFNFTLTFHFQNPNKRMAISYNQIKVDVLYGDDIIESFPPNFDQGAESDKVMEAKVVDMNSRIFASTIKGINEDLINTGIVEFLVDLQAIMTFDRVMGFLIERLRTRCPGVKIRFVNETKNGGTFIGPSIICQRIKMED